MAKQHANFRIARINNIATGEFIEVTYGRAMTLSRKGLVFSIEFNDLNWKMNQDGSCDWETLKIAAFRK